MSRGRGPRGGRPLPERANVDYAWHICRLLEVVCAPDEDTAIRRAAPFLLEKYSTYLSWGIPGITLDPGAEPEEQVFNGFGCSGKNVSPALSWSGAPKDTKSFALLVHDPDAPTGGAGWWHWLVVNIPASVTELKNNAGKADGTNLPQGAEQITTDFGGPGWGGPCPPAGDTPHHYNFTLHALKVEKLDLPKGATAALAGFMVNANSIGKVVLTGKYGRKK